MEQYKNKIISFYKSNKRMPGYGEIMSMLGFKSKNSVYKLINKLVEDGVVNKDARGKLTPNNLVGEIPVLGLVEAGIPSLAEESVLDTMSIDEYLVGRRTGVYILEVKGDSMVEAGIIEGDMVIAETTDVEPKDGEIVIAEVDGGWTMKYYKKYNLKDKKLVKPYLLPANKNYKPIYPEYDLNISAIVRGVIRKYG